MNESMTRLQAIAELVPDLSPIVDVGADHGNIAALIGGMPTERLPHRITGNHHLHWCVADGIQCFRDIGVAVIAGMGAHKIMDILLAGRMIRSAVLHAADKPDELRRLLAKNGWKILDERITHRGDTFDQIILTVPGKEPSDGLCLLYGPHLLKQRTATMTAHLTTEKKRLVGIAKQRTNTPNTHDDNCAKIDFVTKWLDDTHSARLSYRPPHASRTP